MSNGDFQKGTWIQLPSNCTRSFGLTYLRCAEWGIQFITQCLQWISEVVRECTQWAWNQTKKCSWWSLFFCVIFAIVVSFVCLVFTLVMYIVCAVVTIVELVICLLWTIVSVIFCLSNANGGTMFLLTDGTVMMQESKAGPYWLGLGRVAYSTSRWWRLTPDQSGSYAKGKWSQLADSNVARTFYASAVLADGRVIVCGGEYSDAGVTIQNDWNNSCEIYDPVKNTWTKFASPTVPGSSDVWAKIGDAPCALLPDGTFLLGSDWDANVAKLDPSTLTWTAKSPRLGVGTSDEDSWVLMPDNTIAAPSCQVSPTTWVYDIDHDRWNQGNDLQNPVVDTTEEEIGPGLLRYDGTAFFLGATQHTAVYTPGANPAWTNGPDLPDQMVEGKPFHIGIEDGPASLLPNGNILFAAGIKNQEGPESTPCWFFEYDGTAFNRTNDPPNYVALTYSTRLLPLPNGDVMFCREDDSSFYAYHSDAATPQDSFRPVIQTCPANLSPGTTIQISGLQFNGLSQAVGYGDDCTTATNYPLVRIVNNGTQHVRYCRTFNHTTIDSNGNTKISMGVATGAAVITTNVEIPPDIEAGDSSLFVVANGIPSAPFAVIIAQIIV